MVFKSFVVSLLNNYLGKYVRNLDTSNLHIGIWNGDAVLTELTLKDDALADLDLPIEVKSGSIGKLSLAIPWANLYTKPVVVKIEDVFVVAAPFTERDFDAEQAEERLRAAKRRKLLAIDKSTLLQNDETSQLPDDYTLFEKLTAQVIKNVQVFIKNIHVRYEDKVTNPNSPFAVGITLKHLTAETTDEFWETCVVEATVKKVFKLVSLDSLSVYWNTNISSSQQYGKNEEWKIKSLLRDTIKSKDETEDDFEYVLEPFSVEAHVKIDQASAVNMDEPKVTVEVVQRDMVLGLCKTQFRCLMNLIESFELMLTNEPYRKYRPSAPPPGNAKAWWNYAFTAIVQEKIRTWSWSNIRRHRALYYDYKTLYKRELFCNDKGLENSALSSRLQELEEQLDVSSILIAREHAQSEFKINPGLVEEPVDNSNGWWSWMFGENESKKKEPETDFDLSSSFSLSALSPAEKQRLYDALDYSENSEETKYPKEYVKFKLVFSMESFELRLLNEIRRNLAYVSMSGVSGSLLHRPSSANTSFSLEVNDFNIYGHSSNLDEPQPHLVAFQKSGDVDLVLFDFTFELNPIHVTADYAISLILEPVKIVHDTNTVMQIVNFFKIPQSRALQELTDVASSGLQELQIQTRAGLEFAVSRQTIMYFDVNVRSPCIVVPEYGAMQRPGSVFVVDFGHLTVKTDLNSKRTVIQDATESELENMLCDNFNVTLSEMQILIADKGVDWESAHAQSSSPYHLLPASKIDLEILRNTNVICSLPEIKVSGVLKVLEIKLSEEKYQELMQFISNIPLLTEPLDEDDGQFLRIYPQTLSRHSSRLSLEEAVSIQAVLREALSTANVTHDEDEFEDAEEAQDIDDNEEWFLAPDEFENKENKLDIRSMSPSRAVDDNAKKDQVTLTGDFSIKQVSLVFNKFAENVDQLYINLVISDLGVKVAFLEWEMKVGANLGSLHLIDHLFKDVDGSPLTVLSSIADKDLISFSYKKVDPKCPYLNTTYEGVEHCITTEFSALNVFLHREGIVTFQDFILALIERSAKPNLQKLGERFSSYLEVIPEEEPMKDVVLNSKEKELTTQYSGSTKAKVALGEVLVTLSANECHFAMLTINGLRFDVLLEKRKTCIKASLKHFDVEDLDKDTLYNKILTAEDNNLGDAEVTFYSREKGIQANPLEVDMDVLFNFGRLKFVFLHHFVSALQNFFASFASDETRQCAQEATTQAVQIQVESLRETSPKIRLRLDINAPVIKIPVKSQSKNGVIVYLGRLQVNNELKYHSAANNSGLMDVSCIRLNSFQVTRSMTAESWMGNYNLVDPTGLDITLTRCLEESCGTIPAYEMKAVLEQLSVSVDEGDFKLLTKTWVENVQQTLMVEPDGGVPLDDDIFNMPEVEQHEMEKNDLRQVTNPPHNNDQDWRMRLNAIIGNVSLMFPKSVNNERVPYLELNVDELKADVEVAGCTTEGSASLGNLCLFDHHHKGNSLKPLSVLESSRDNDLISIKYKKETSEGQPSNVTQTLDILSTVIKMHLEQKSILGIQELVTKFLESSKRYGSQLSLYNAAREIELDAKESETEDEEMKKSDNFKLTVNMRKVDVILSRKKVNIVRALIEDIFTEILAADDKFVIYSRQKGLSVTDLNPLSNYRDVIAIEGSKLFDFEYHSLGKTSTTSSTINGKPTFSTKPHGALSLTIGKIHLVFLYRLIANIQAFIQALVSPEMTSYSYELVQKTVQDQLRSIEDQGMRIALKVNIEAPIVVFPSHSQSLDCLVADLGQLHAGNEFVTRHPPNDVTQIVLIDQVNVGLESVQLSRGILDKNSRTMTRRLLIQPVKMSMVLSRSMHPNAHWLPYLDVKMQLDHIEMNMDDGDYQLLVCALQQNFAEAGEVVADGAGVSDNVFVSLSMVDNVDMHNTSLREETDEGVKGGVKETTEKLWDELKIDFTFSGLSLTLHHNQDVTKLSPDSLQHHNALASLCNCELQQSRGTLVTHSDSSMDVHLFLYGCVIEDARPSKMTAFPRMLSHSTEQEHGRKKRFSKNGNVEHQKMIEVLYKQTPSGEMKVNLTLQDPTLYISFPLLWSLLDFFTVSPAEETAFSQSDFSLGQSTREEAVPNDAPPYVLEVTGALKNPEIILLGEPENPNSSALIIQTTIDFVYKLVDDQQNFTTSSKELVVHSCRYPEREKTLYNVVKPCAINFLYSYPGSDCEGQEIDLRIPEMKVKVSPLLLRTLLAIYNSFYGEQETVEEIVPEQVVDNEELWRPQPICKGDWYNKTSLDRVPSRIHLNTTVTEKFFMEIKSVRITLYNEVMTHRVPLLLVNSNIVSHVRDWSSELKLETDLTVEAWYHNEMLAAWEPLVESEETLSGRRHWQLQLKVFQANSHLLSFSPEDKDQKIIDEEDFRCLTTSPVFEDSRRSRRERERPTSPKSSAPQYSFENVYKAPPISPALSESSVETTGKSTVGVDEVDSVFPSIPSPISSDKEIEQPEEIPQATYIVLSSYDIMQLTVTRPAVDVITDLTKVLSDVTSVSSTEAALPESPFIILNELGIHASVSVSHRHETIQHSTNDLTISKRKRMDISDLASGSSPSKTRLHSLGYVHERRRDAVSQVRFQIKDDSGLKESHGDTDGWDEDGLDGAICSTDEQPLDYENEVPDTPIEKRIFRSQSMPAANMCRLIKLTEKRNQASRAAADGALQESCNEDEGDIISSLKEKVPKSSLEESGGENLERVEGLPNGFGESRCSESGAGAGMVVGDIEEAKGEVEEGINSMKEVENCGKREADLEEVHEIKSEEKTAPSFISGAFATMGLMAGISAHPISSDKLVSNPTENCEALFERPEYKKADDYISIQVDGFKELAFILVTHAGRFPYQLCPKKNGRFYYIVVQIEIKHGQKRVTIRSPLQVKNNLETEIDLYVSKTRPRSNDSFEVKYRKINTVQPKEIGNVPLFSAHHGNLFIQPTSAGFKKSTASVSLKDFSESNQTILTCLPEENGPKHSHCVKVICEKDSLNTSPSKMALHHILQLHPTLSFCNFLPFAVKLKLEDANVTEMYIEPGKRCHVMCVTTNKTSTFSLKVPQHMGTSWSGFFKLGGDSPRDLQIEMQPGQTANNTLLIRMHYLDRGCLVVNFYSPYWFVNKTNLTIEYKSTKISSESYKQLASDNEPLLYDSSSKTKKIMLRLRGCDWSNSFSMDAVGNAGQLSCKELKTSREYELSISIELSHNRLTKIITVVPKYVIINKTEHKLSILEIGEKENLWILVNADKCVPFWPRTKCNALIVRLNDNILTSKTIRIDSLFPTIFRVGGGTLMEMNSEITEHSTTIIFSPSSSTSLPKVENLCEDISINLQQKNASSTTVVAPLTSIVYSWDEPGGNQVLLWQPVSFRVSPVEVPVHKDGFGKVVLDERRRTLSSSATKKVKKTSILTSCMRRRSEEIVIDSQTNEICDLAFAPWARNKHSVKKVIYWVSFLHGLQRVIVFTDDKSCAREARKHCEGEAVVLEVFLSLDGVRLSVVNQQPSEIMYLGISSATSIWEVEKSPGKWKILGVEISSLLEEAWRNEGRGQRLEKDVEVDFETMSMTKPYRGTLNRRYEPGLWVHYCSSISYESFSAKVHRVQVDNQIFGTLFPCALYPSPVPVSISHRYGFKPFCEISVIYRNDPKHSLLHLRYFKVLIQEMNVKLEKDFLLAISEMLYGDCSVEHDEEMPFQENLRNTSLTLKDTLTESDTQRLFLEHFHLSPLKINLSISLQSNLYRSEKQKDHESDLFRFLVNSVGAPLTEVNDVLIKLACFERSGLFVTQGSLVLSAKKHYTWQALRQFHAIVLGLDVLGNPYGLLTDLQEGVKDLFYEPYQGIVLGPQEFASGIVRGVKSLLGHAIGGTTGAMSKITGTFGQAFASLSFDHDYRMKRRLRMGSGPTGIQDGVTMAGKSLFMGIVFGVSGVVTKPIQGARAEGVEGFFKGFGKGILGLVTRPTVGVFDMVTTTLDGIRRSAEQAGEHVVVRLRIDPRFSPPDAPLRPYLAYQANGNCILKSLPRSSEIINDVYVDHVPLPKEGHSSIALFTNVRMMEVQQTVFWSEWKVNLDLPYQDISDSARLIHGAMVIMRKNGECVTIESTDEVTLQAARKKLEEQLYHYRATR